MRIINDVKNRMIFPVIAVQNFPNDPCHDTVDPDEDVEPGMCRQSPWICLIDELNWWATKKRMIFTLMISLFVIAISASKIISPMIFALLPLLVVVLLFVPLSAAKHVADPNVIFRIVPKRSRFVGVEEILMIRGKLFIITKVLSRYSTDQVAFRVVGRSGRSVAWWWLLLTAGFLGEYWAVTEMWCIEGD